MRVYDAGTRGFLSPDPLASPVGAGWGANVYAFAGFDPVGLVDPWGASPVSRVEFAQYAQAHPNGIGAAVKDNWQYIAATALAVTGVALAVASGPVGWAILGGMALSGGTSLVSQGFSKGWGQIDWKEVAKEATIGGLSNALGFGALKLFKGVGGAVMKMGSSVVSRGQSMIGAGSRLRALGSGFSQLASRVSTGVWRSVASPVRSVGRFLESQGGRLGTWGSRVVSVGDDIAVGGARVFGARVTGYEAVQGGSSNVMAYATDGQDHSVMDYVRHGFVGVGTGAFLPDWVSGKLGRVGGFDEFVPKGRFDEVLKFAGGKFFDGIGDFSAGYVNSMSERNNWNPFDQNNLDKSTIKGFENVGQGVVPLPDALDKVDGRAVVGSGGVDWDSVAKGLLKGGK